MQYRVILNQFCNGKYTEENLIQCQIDLCGYIDDTINKLLEDIKHEH